MTNKKTKILASLSVALLISAAGAIVIKIQEPKYDDLSFSEYHYSEFSVEESRGMFGTEFYGTLKDTGLKFKILKPYIDELKQLEKTKSKTCLSISYDSIGINKDGSVEKNNFRIQKNQYMYVRSCK
jgi:hypothetical protein